MYMNVFVFNYWTCSIMLHLAAYTQLCVVCCTVCCVAGMCRVNVLLVIATSVESICNLALTDLLIP